MHDPTHRFEGTISPKTEKIAKIISTRGQPPFLAIIPFIAICMSYSEDSTTGILASIASVLSAVVIPISVIVFFSKKYGNADKLDVERKEDRMWPLIAGIIGYSIGVVLLYLLGAPWLATVLMICYVLVTLAIAFITPFWKISVHACGVIGPSMGLAAAFWPFGVLYILLLPPIMWSRYFLKKHTPLQLVGGALVGFVITYLIFFLLL